MIGFAAPWMLLALALLPVLVLCLTVADPWLEAVPGCFLPEPPPLSTSTATTAIAATSTVTAAISPRLTRRRPPGRSPPPP